MKTALMLMAATGITESIGNTVLDKATPRPVKTYPTKSRLVLAVAMTIALHYALPFVENKVLGSKPAPKTIFG